MIATGVLFKADFDMSKISDSDILKQFNPTLASEEPEKIQANSTSTVEKQSYKFKTIQAVTYKSEDEGVISQILNSSRFMEYAAPKLLKVIELSPTYILVAFPYYDDWSLSSSDFNSNEEFLDELENLGELNSRIEETIKELARVTMYFMSSYENPIDIRDSVKEYVSLCFKFPGVEESEGNIISKNIDDIVDDLNNKLNSLIEEESKKNKNGKDDQDKN